MNPRSFTLTAAERQRIDRIDQLVILGSGGVGELVAAVSDPSWTVRRAAVAGLVALGDDAVPALLAWLVDQRTSEHAIAGAVDALSGSTGATATRAALTMLASDRPEVAADGASILGRRHATEATAALAAQLEHRDDNVALAAIEALGSLAPATPAAAIDPLIAVLERRSFFRAFPALQVLARTGDPRAVRPIAELIADPIFRSEAIRALGRTGSASAIAPLTAVLTTDHALVGTVAIALADLITRAEWSGAGANVAQTLTIALAPLIDLFIAAIDEERAAIITVLGRTNEPRVVPVLAGLLDDETTRLLATDAIKAIARNHELALLGAGAPAALLPLVTSLSDAPRLRELVRDPEAEVRARACEALARLGDTAAVPALFEALADPNPRVALAAVGAIQALNTEGTAARALTTLATGTTIVRRHVLRIIAYLGLADAFEPVRAATTDPDRRIVELAIAALATSPDPRADTVLGELTRAPDGNVRAHAMRAWAHRESDHAVAQLEAGLADEDAWVRYYACQGLGRLDHAASTTLLLARLADATPHVRVAAIEALARFETPPAWQALISAVKSSDPDECRAALVGLGQRPREGAVPILVEAARGSDLASRLIAISGLAVQPGQTAIRELVAAARDREPAVRDAAMSLLDERDDREAIDAAIELALEAAPGDPVALSRATPTRIAAIADALATTDDHAAAVLTAALARMATPAAVTMLFEALEIGNPAARRAAAGSLIALGANGAPDAVRRLATEDPDPDVRRICTELSRQ